MTPGHAARLARIVEGLGADLRPLHECDERGRRATEAWLRSLPPLRVVDAERGARATPRPVDPSI